MSTVPTIVLGGTGYVAGELLRLIASHPHLQLAGVMSDSSAGEPVAGAFPHLATVYPHETFKSQAEIEELVRRERAPAILAAAPHGVSAKLIDTLLTVAEQAGNSPRVVDLSADFRYASTAAYEAAYQRPHGAPARIAQFSCAVPEHLRHPPTPHVAHPGCFATTILLAAVPLLATGLIEPQLFVSAVTGSTGSGRHPLAGTHHPTRHGNLYAYNALTHRHAPEIGACARPPPASTRTSPSFRIRVRTRVASTPRSRRCSNGRWTARKYSRASRLLRALAVRAGGGERTAAQGRGRQQLRTSRRRERWPHVAVMSVADNLNKGAAGGAMQWMNRLLGYAESAGLTAPAAGWT